MTEQAYVPFLNQVAVYGDNLRDVGAYVVEKRQLTDSDIKEIVGNIGKLAAIVYETYRVTAEADQLQLPEFAEEADTQVMADFVTAWSNSVALTVKAASELKATMEHAELEVIFNKTFMATRLTNVLRKQNVEFLEAHK
ncbi:hypothetical protein EQG49_11915 [Periweissella cryptocerci]|uniref:Uncharacterized protein n=1 Tax=Periweissella cryptocerci TaxID=2506420 RepID=A0A4P6YWB9_9LACO|nr:hypothetical protein [Periweissella cryptocerci]QBO37110.1 hypothetical protein EQG49_11915 [Periweissella cryptocerci]